ncbi:MAG TPA: type II toxin-antitoxin system RelE/ParE family toxin [Thermoanaerobaculia bacterium]|nr:type II toxin-antitoxin system RelE/ParE family toxin [Thermoanaerobaculia bacterium]
MKLVRLARKRWEVLAFCDSRGRCPVTEFLEGLMGTSYQVAAVRMGRLLVIQIPTNGPPRSEPLCKSLGEGLFELRKQPKGKKLRIVWFYGGGAVVVCAVAFTKAERTPRSQIERARALQRSYMEAKRNGTLEISDT